MRYFITGAAGFVGPRLIQKLLEAENNVVVANARRKFPFLHERLEFIESDLFDLRQKIDADILIHLVGSPGVWFSERNPAEDYRINVESIDAAFEMMNKQKLKRAVLASSCQVYGNGPSEEPLDPSPNNEYGRNKLKAETLFKKHCAECGIRYSVLRMSWIYGPGMKKNPIYDVLNGKSYLSLDSMLDFIFVDDVCEAFVSASKDKIWDNKTVNISSGEAMSVKRICQIFRTLGFQGEVREDSTLRRNVVISNKQARSLGWSPRINIEKGLEKTYESFQQEMRQEAMLKGSL